MSAGACATKYVPLPVFSPLLTCPSHCPFPSRIVFCHPRMVLVLNDSLQALSPLSLVRCGAWVFHAAAVCGAVSRRDTCLVLARDDQEGMLGEVVVSGSPSTLTPSFLSAALCRPLLQCGVCGSSTPDGGCPCGCIHATPLTHRPTRVCVPPLPHQLAPSSPFQRVSSCSAHFSSGPLARLRCTHPTRALPSPLQGRCFCRCHCCPPCSPPLSRAARPFLVFSTFDGDVAWCVADIHLDGG